MTRTIPLRFKFALILALTPIPATTLAPAIAVAAPSTGPIPLSALAASAPHEVSVRTLRHLGRQAVEIRPLASASAAGSYATLPGLQFQDGEVTAEIAAEVIPGIRRFALLPAWAFGAKALPMRPSTCGC